MMRFAGFRVSYNRQNNRLSDLPRPALGPFGIA
jgi:hypothetical protein